MNTPANETERLSWARLRKHGPTMIFDWHPNEQGARDAITRSADKYGEQVRKFQTVAFFPDEVPDVER